MLGQTPQPPQDQYITPLGAPDISAADISEEQLARIYSQSSVWDPKKDPVPPMQQMEGFGRFRRSVHANADWQLRRFRGDLQALGPAAMKQLGDFEIAGLKDGVMDNIIRETSSCTSLNSHSDSGDSSTGTRICKGFKPSHTRSKSMNDAKTGNTTPMPTKSKSATLRRPRRCSFLRDDDDSAPAPLPTIEESAPTPQTKKTVPLIFDAQGGADKVIDTDEYETCDDSYSPTNDDQMFAARALAQQMARIERVPKILRQRYVGYHPSWDIIPYKPHAYPKKKPVTRRLSSRCGGCM